jgi:membrane protein
MGRNAIETRAADLLRLVRAAYRRGQADEIGDAAGSLAYYGFTALPAILLVSLGIFVLLAGPGAVDELARHLQTVVPADAVSLLRGNLRRAVENDTGGLVIVAAGFAVALWAASGAMLALQRALNRVYRCEETRGFVRRRAAAGAMLAFVFVALALTVAALVLGPYLSRWIGDAVGAETLTRWAWWAGQWPLLLVALFGATTAVFRFGPARARGTGRVPHGPALAVVLVLAASGLFSVYVSHFGSYAGTWGPLSAVVVTLVWLRTSAYALLLGAELDAELTAAAEEAGGTAG